MRKISLPLYFTTLLTYFTFAMSMIAIFGAAEIAVLVGGTTPPDGVLSGFLYHAGGWLSGQVGRGLFILIFFSPRSS